MILKKGEKNYPDAVRRTIAVMASNRTPLAISLQNTDHISPSLIDSCRSYYDFISMMLKDMYENPLEYGLNPGGLEQFLNGRPVNAYKRKSPAKVEELCSEMHDSVFNYYRFYLALATAGTRAEDSLKMSADDYAQIRKQFDRTLAPKKKTNDNRIPYEIRLNALSRIGFIIVVKNDEVSVNCTSFPNMFEGMCALAASVPTIKTFGEQGFFNCEFRQIFDRHTPEYEDVVRPLEDDARMVMDVFHSLAKSERMNPLCTTFWKVNYKWKGEQMMQISINGNISRLWVTGAAGNEPEEQRLMNEWLSEESPEFQRYALRHLHYCTGCSSSHLGRFIQVLGKRKRTCSGGSINFHIYDMKESDIEYFKKFIEYRKRIILLHKGK